VSGAARDVGGGLRRWERGGGGGGSLVRGRGCGGVGGGGGGGGGEEELGGVLRGACATFLWFFSVLSHSQRSTDQKLKTSLLREGLDLTLMEAFSFTQGIL